MSTIAEKLNALILQKKTLSDNLNTKGVESSEDEKFNTLVEKVLDIETGIDTSDADVTSEDILENKIAYSNGEKVIGSIPSLTENTYIPTTENITINSGKYISEDQTILGDSNLLAENIKSGVTIFNVDGTFTNIEDGETAVTSDDIKKNLVAYINGEKVIGSAYTLNQEFVYTPDTSDHYLQAGFYSGISLPGDENLIAENIKEGVTIFNVEGTYKAEEGNTEGGIDTSDADATENDILLDKTAYVNGEKIVGTIESLDTTTYTPTVEDIVITSGKYLSGDQIIKGDENLVAENIKSGTKLFGIVGTYDGGTTEEAGDYLLLDCTSITDADSIISTYGDLVYISEDDGASFTSLKELNDLNGGTSADSNANFVASKNTYNGICMDNWTSTSNEGSILFVTPIEITTGKGILRLKYGESSWMNTTINFNLIEVTGDNDAENIEQAIQKIANSDFVGQLSIYCAGSASGTDNYSAASSIPNGNYLVYATGTSKKANSCFTYIDIECICY
jgi:hypothetical protein